MPSANFANRGLAILGLLFFVQIGSSAQPITEATDVGWSISASKSGSLYFSGNFESNNGTFSGMNHGKRDAFLLKLDRDGQKKWICTLGGSGDDFSNSTNNEFSDGSQIWLVNSESNDFDFSQKNKNLDIWIVKVSEDGKILWKKNFGGAGWDFGTFATVTKDDGFILGGVTKSPDWPIKSNHDEGGSGFLLKCNNHGIIQWAKLFQGVGYDEIFYCDQTSSGDFLSLYKTNSTQQLGLNPSAEANLVAILHAENGSEKYRLCLSQNGYVSSKKWCRSIEGGFVFAGHFRSVDSISTKFHEGYWLAQSDSLLNFQWEKRMNVPRHGLFESILLMEDRTGYLACGIDLDWTFAQSAPNSNHASQFKNALLAKIGPTGEVNWANYLSGKASDNYFNMVQTSDSGVVIAGWTNSTDSDFASRRNLSTDALLVKFDRRGQKIWQKTFGGWRDDQVVGFSKWAFPIRFGQTEPFFINYIDFSMGVLTSLVVGLVFGIFKIRKKNKIKLTEIRENVARDLHDELGSTVGSIALFGKSLQKMGGMQDPVTISGLQRITENAEKSLETIRDIVWTIDTGNDLATDLVARACEFAQPIAELTAIDCRVTSTFFSKEMRLGPDLKKNLWLIFKEGVSNAFRYSGTASILVHFSFGKNEVILTIQDFGSGFDTQLDTSGNGLRNLKRRAEELNGKLTIDSSPVTGTRIRLQCNLKPK